MVKYRRFPGKKRGVTISADERRARARLRWAERMQNPEFQEKMRIKAKRLYHRDLAKSRAEQRAYRTSRVQHYRKLNWESRLRCWYGLSFEAYQQMFQQQGGLCAICQQPEKRKSHWNGAQTLAVDHCHATKKVRALLCSGCNGKVGTLENLTWRVKAEAYLKEHANG